MVCRRTDPWQHPQHVRQHQISSLPTVLPFMFVILFWGAGGDRQGMSTEAGRLVRPYILNSDHLFRPLVLWLILTCIRICVCQLSDLDQHKYFLKKEDFRQCRLLSFPLSPLWAPLSAAGLRMLKGWRDGSLSQG